MRRPPLDLSLYLLVGPADTRDRALRDVVLPAVDGGVTAVQLRWKEHTTRAFVDEARALLSELRPLGVPLIVNDRVDVALAAGADGIHVGQEDMRVEDVRRLVGAGMLVGLSVTSAAEAAALDPRLVDYAGVGPVFATPSKADASTPLGPEGTRRLVEGLEVPAVAIGGITSANVASVMATGVRGVAVISAICGADSPREAAEELMRTRRL